MCGRSTLGNVGCKGNRGGRVRENGGGGRCASAAGHAPTAGAARSGPAAAAASFALSTTVFFTASIFGIAGKSPEILKF